jgi:hypothetical protein
MHAVVGVQGTVQAFELALQYIQPFLAATGDDDAPTFGSEPAGSGLTETAGGAGDEDEGCGHGAKELDNGHVLMWTCAHVLMNARSE